MKKYTFFIFLILLLFHFPFLDADPDSQISFSRDAFTDEGLYTSQVRNYILTGTFNLYESDAALKTPAFSFLMFLAFKIFGIHHEIARLTVLLLSLTVAYFVFRKDIWLTVLMVAITFLQYTVFQYTHYSLAEFVSVSCLLSGWYFLSNTHLNFKIQKRIFLACLFVSLAFWIKFQYLYMLVWPIAFYILNFIYIVLLGKKEWKSILNKLLFSFGLTILFLIIYLLTWYLPNKDFFEYVINSQTEVVFGEGEWFRKMIDFNITHFFLNANVSPLTWLFLICLAISPFVLYRFRNDEKIVLQILAVFAWCVLEVHKPALAYLPGRYLISPFFAMGLFSSLIIKGLCLMVPVKRYRFALVAVCICWPIITNIQAYLSVYKNRTYVFEEVNDFMSKNFTHTCTIAGAWAPSISWKLKMPAIPVWKDYFNDKSTMEKFNPCLIIAESDEEDSGFAWKSQGIDLSKIAQQRKEFQAGKWKVLVYELSAK